MEESSRNSNRTANRNEETLLAFTKTIPCKQTSFFYQYCANPKCKEITLCILPSANSLSEEDKNAFVSIMKLSTIPGLILEYPEGDTIQATLIQNDGKIQGKKDVSWNEVIDWMQARQLTHEENSSVVGCDKYTHTRLNPGTWKSDKNDTRFSNIIRTIPGVRHIDIDGMLQCPNCNLPLFLIEATSDGCPGTPMANKFKATTMTRKLANVFNATPLLVQHHYQDCELAEPVYLTSWTSGKQKRYKRTWEQLREDFKRAIARHKCQP